MRSLFPRCYPRRANQKMRNQWRKFNFYPSLARRLKHQMATRMAPNRRSFTTSEGHRPIIIHKRSLDILHDPWFNKGTAFTLDERDRLDLRGLLPPNIMSFEQQMDRFMVDLNTLKVKARDGPTDPYALFKWRLLNRLHDRNETMYYRVDMILVTDGSRILGLGDLGVQGIGIAVGKLDLYVAAAGINPQRVLPVMIDVGTNNEKLRRDPMYLGLQDPRLDGEEYLAVIDEFMEAVYTRWPHVIVQGTAGVAIAGLLGAVRAQGKPMTDFPKQKIVVAGAGSAGIGVLNAATNTMTRILGNTETAFESARSQFWVVDDKGLITEERKEIDPGARPFARKATELASQGLREGASLVDVVHQVKPDVLLGLSAVGGLFSREVLEALKGSHSTRPAIFAMSNPTKNAECTPKEAFSVLGEDIIFASGSPFKDVDLGDGKIGHCNQGNNMYLFPGIGLGTLLSGATIVSDGMLEAAAGCLAEYMTEEEVHSGVIFPSTSRIREITKEVAAAVIKEALEEDLAEGYRGTSVRELQKLNQEQLLGYVSHNMWNPEYSTLVYKEK